MSDVSVLGGGALREALRVMKDKTHKWMSVLIKETTIETPKLFLQMNNCCVCLCKLSFLFSIFENSFSLIFYSFIKLFHSVAYHAQYSGYIFLRTFSSSAEKVSAIIYSNIT